MQTILQCMLSRKAVARILLLLLLELVRHVRTCYLEITDRTENDLSYGLIISEKH